MMGWVCVLVQEKVMEKSRFIHVSNIHDNNCSFTDSPRCACVVRNVHDLRHLPAIDVIEALEQVLLLLQKHLHIDTSCAYL
jgi:hypothetical protein